MILAQVKKGAPSPLADRKQLLNILKAEQNFIEFSDRALPIQFHKAYSIELDPTDPKRETAQFYVCTNGPKGKCIVSALPPRPYEFRVAVPSDLDGEYGHESGVAKFVFLVRSSHAFCRFTRVLTRTFSWMHRLLLVLAAPAGTSSVKKHVCSQFLSGRGFPDLFKESLAIICSKNWTSQCVSLC